MRSDVIKKGAPAAPNRSLLYALATPRRNWSVPSSEWSVPTMRSSPAT